jgi:ribose transport system ATP-binding protein
MTPAVTPVRDEEVAVADEAPSVRVEHLTKSFADRTVLSDVSFNIPAGKVVALLGQNGSGKSTLIKLLSGFHAPDSGAGSAIVIGEERLSLPLRHDLHDFRIAVVHQDLALLPSASVTETLLIDRIGDHALGALSWGEVHARARLMLETVGAVGIRERSLVSDLKPVQRAMVAIARAIDELSAGGLLILDEITAFLTQDGIDQLFELIRTVAARGIGVLFVSHRMEEVWRICERAVVLRNGELIADVELSETSEDELVTKIVGQRLEWLYPEKNPTSHEVRVRFRDVRAGPLRHFELEARSGEIIGLTGLRGMGYERVVYSLYGETPGCGGTVEIGGKVIPLAGLRPRHAFGLGLRLVPSDRLLNGAVGGATVRENASLPHLDKFIRRGFLNRRSERLWALDLVTNYGVSPVDTEAFYSRLSGGNQQKVLMARWLETKPEVLLLDEPTQGVDVGARREIFSRIVDAAGKGMTVLYSTSETQDLAELCHRVLVFRDGVVAGELRGEQVSEEAISRMCWASGPGKTESEPERVG